MKKIHYRPLEAADFDASIALATKVHGAGYIDKQTMHKWYEKGLKGGINSSFVAYDEQVLVGFRLTFSIKQWHIDQWCSPNLWPVNTEQVCYFKCNTVNENYRGFGVGSQLLTLSISAAKKQGALAGISHLWRQSPGNSAVKYFTKCGGQLIKDHPDRWHKISTEGYDCTICHFDCHCVAAEMLIVF
jgi:GNAT superfamily N-acetyltransferase